MVMEKETAQVHFTGVFDTSKCSKDLEKFIMTANQKWKSCILAVATKGDIILNLSEKAK